MRSIAFALQLVRDFQDVVRATQGKKKQQRVRKDKCPNRPIMERRRSGRLQNQPAPCYNEAALDKADAPSDLKSFCMPLNHPWLHELQTLKLPLSIYEFNLHHSMPVGEVCVMPHNQTLHLSKPAVDPNTGAGGHSHCICRHSERGGVYWRAHQVTGSLQGRVVRIYLYGHDYAIPGQKLQSWLPTTCKGMRKPHKQYCRMNALFSFTIMGHDIGNIWGTVLCCRPLFVDGYSSDGTRVYDKLNGQTCHQCRQKTIGLRTQCSKCSSHKVRLKPTLLQSLVEL